MPSNQLWDSLSGQVPSLLLFCAAGLYGLRMFLDYLRDEGKKTRESLRALRLEMRKNSKLLSQLVVITRQSCGNSNCPYEDPTPTPNKALESLDEQETL